MMASVFYLSKFCSKALESGSTLKLQTAVRISHIITTYCQHLLKTDTNGKARRNINHKLAKHKVSPCNMTSQRARWFSTTDNATCCHGKIFNIDGLPSITIFITITSSKSTSRAHVPVLPHSVQIFLLWS